jgi:hypothetical protein
MLVGANFIDPAVSVGMTPREGIHEMEMYRR